MSFNLVLTDGKKSYVHCYYGERKNYFSVRYFQNDDINIVSSEPYKPYKFKTMQKKEIIVL